MNKHIIDKLSRKKLKVKQYTKEEAEALAKEKGLKVSEDYGKSEELNEEVEEKEDDDTSKIRANRRQHSNWNYTGL